MAKKSKASGKSPKLSAKDAGNKKKKSSMMAAAQRKANSRPKKKGGIKEYFKGVKLEMKKVVWPTKKELGSYTAIVLITCCAFALAFWAIDSGVLAAIKAVCF